MSLRRTQQQQPFVQTAPRRRPTIDEVLRAGQLVAPARALSTGTPPPADATNREAERYCQAADVHFTITHTPKNNEQQQGYYVKVEGTPEELYHMVLKVIMGAYCPDGISNPSSLMYRNNMTVDARNAELLAMISLVAQVDKSDLEFSLEGNRLKLALHETMPNANTVGVEYFVIGLGLFMVLSGGGVLPALAAAGALANRVYSAAKGWQAVRKEYDDRVTHYSKHARETPEEIRQHMPPLLRNPEDDPKVRDFVKRFLNAYSPQYIDGEKLKVVMPDGY